MSAPYSITVTAMSRPALFRRLLESLVKNDLTGWRVVIRVEPGERAPEFEPIAAEVLAGIEYDLRVNPRVEGITRNPYLALEDAFAAGSQLNLYLEEDLEVSPDATALALWYEREHRPGWLCLSLLAGPCGSAAFLSNPAYPDLLFEARTFNSIGFVMRREEWYAFARDVWLIRPGRYADLIHANWRTSWGWDWSLYGLVAANDALRTVQPVLARATHTGREGGSHATPAFHDVAFGDLPINYTSFLDYRLTDVADLPRDVRAHVLAQEELRDMRMQLEAVSQSLSTGVTTPDLSLSATHSSAASSLPASTRAKTAPALKLDLAARFKRLLYNRRR